MQKKLVVRTMIAAVAFALAGGCCTCIQRYEDSYII